MTQQQHQPWKLSVRARAKSLDLKLKSVLPPHFKLFRFSIRFKLHPHVLEIKSTPQSSFSFKSKSLKLKFLQIFKNFHRKRSKNKGGIVRGFLLSASAHKNYLCGRRKPCIWLWVVLFAMVGCFVVIMQLRDYYYCRGFVWKYIWKVLKFTAPPGLLHQFSKVIFNGICRSLGF